MTHFEMVEKLREKANVSYEEAKSALETSDWDLLDAMVLLEKQGQVNGEAQRGEGDSADYTTRREKRADWNGAEQGRSSSFGDMLGKLGRAIAKLVARGNANTFEVYRNGQNVFALPVTALVILLVVAFWFCVPLMVVGLFFGYKYSFSGPDLGKDSINQAIHRASEAADEMKRDLSSEHHKKGGESDV